MLLAPSNFLFVIFGIAWTNGFARLINISCGIIVSTIMTVCVLGSFAIRNSFFDTGVPGFFGIPGILMKKVGTNSPLPITVR